MFSEQSQPFRRGGGPRQTSEGWRRSQGNDDENNEQNEDSSTQPNGSSSWTSRGGQARRGGGTIENRTKSNDKWSHNDDRPGTYKKEKFSIENVMFLFLLQKKVHRIVMNPINNVDGDRMQLYLIVILILVVHKQNAIV